MLHSLTQQGNIVAYAFRGSRLQKSIKKNDWCFACRSHTEKYLFYDFECTQNTGTHEVNLAIVQDYNGNEDIYNNIADFCRNMINDKFKGYTLIAHNSKGCDAYFILKWLVGQGMKPYCIYIGAK